MATLIAVASQKGGAGKTTTAINLAGGLQKAGYSVLVIDADPQASATAWSIAKEQGSLGFDVMPGSLVQDLHTTATPYDIALIDCPPGMADAQAANTLSKTQTFARTAVRVADAVLVPLRPSTLDFTAAASFVRFLGKQLSPSQRVLVLLNGIQSTTVLSRQAPLQAAALFSPIEGATILASTIGLRIPIAEVSGSGQTIFDYRPDHEAAREYTNLTKEIIQCLSSRNEPTSASSATSPVPASLSHSAA